MIGAYRAREPKEYFLPAIIFSVVIHILLAWILAGSHSHALAAPTVIDVTFTPEKSQPAQQRNRQMVTTPDAPPSPPSSTPPQLLSDKDTSVPKESVHRGDDPNAGPKISKNISVAPPAPPAPQTKSVRPQEQQREEREPAHEQPKHIQQFLLDDQTLNDTLGDISAKTPPTKTSSSLASPLSNYRAFSRPSGSGASVFGLRGTPDYLPSLPDGDLTLLNAKAEKFAVFVRRVALQVFTNLRQSGWESLNAQEIRGISDFTTVEAVLSADGKLLRVTLQGGSGSPKFDSILQVATKDGARDPNPPPNAAAADGRIHFIFKARSWSQIIKTPQGFPTEQRWILLATGLE